MTNLFFIVLALVVVLFAGLALILPAVLEHEQKTFDQVLRERNGQQS